MPEGAHEGETTGRRSAPAHRRSGASGTRSGGPFRRSLQDPRILGHRFGRCEAFRRQKEARYSSRPAQTRRGQPIRRRNQTLSARKTFTAAKTVTFGMLFVVVSRRRRVRCLGYRAATTSRDPLGYRRAGSFHPGTSRSVENDKRESATTCRPRPRPRPTARRRDRPRRPRPPRGRPRRAACRRRRWGACGS